MKKNILTILLTFTILFAYSQKNRGYKKPSIPNQEIGISLGVANYLGDLAWKGKIPLIDGTNPNAFRPAGGIYYRNNFTKFTSFKASFLMGGLFGSDAQTNGDPFRISRNLSFRSIVADASLMFEWNILPYKIGDKKKMFTPYLGIGLAGFYFSPQAQLNGRWVDLQSLGTEGQGIIPGKSKYSKFQLAIPAAIGIKANLTKRLALNVEFQYRHTFTDYIDDVSSDSYVNPNIFYDNYITAIADEANALAYRALDPSLTPRDADRRGNSEFNDHYYFVLVGISYRIGKSNISCAAFR